MPDTYQREQREGCRHDHAERAVRGGDGGLVARIAFVRLISHGFRSCGLVNGIYRAWQICATNSLMQRGPDIPANQLGAKFIEMYHVEIDIPLAVKKVRRIEDLVAGLGKNVVVAGLVDVDVGAE
jgi:hypothetical protein